MGDCVPYRGSYSVCYFLYFESGVLKKVFEFGRRWSRKEEAEEKCIMRRFGVCNFHQILVG